MDSQRIVDYYLAPHSPWVYLGHDRFAALLVAQRAVVRIKPIELGAVFAVSGGLPLGQRAAQRQSYRLLELARHAKHLGLPMNVQPRFFPVAGDPAARTLVAVAEAVGDDAAMRLAAAIQRALWVDERDISDAATLDALVTGCGLDAVATRERALAPATQARYAANTEQAIADEVFGAPTYVPRFGPAKDERFWGQDRLDLLADALRWPTA